MHGLNTPVVVVLFGLATSFILGWGTRHTGALAAAVLIIFAIALDGHQPVGLPQNAGLAAAAMALTLLGPGPFALGKQPKRLRTRDVQIAGWLIRLGLCLTFLVYSFYKFSAGDEYRIVVAEAPMISYVARLLGAQATVNVVGVAELLMAVLMLPGFGRLWGALFQAFALGSFLFALGYPFSYPQDLGLIGVIAAFYCTQTISLPVSLRRGQSANPLSWLKRVALDQRGMQRAAGLSGAVLTVHFDASTPVLLARLRVLLRQALRPMDLIAPSSEHGYCVLLEGVESSAQLDIVLRRVRAGLAEFAAHDVRLGAALWSPTQSLPLAMQQALRGEEEGVTLFGSQEAGRKAA
jgi:hypothetical protein